MDKTIPIFSSEQMKLHDFRLSSVRGEEYSAQFDWSKLHRHDCLEIFWITSGSGTVQIDFQKYSFAPNTLCLISPGQIHKWMENESDPIRGYLLMFSKDMLADNRVENLNWPAVSLFHLLGENPFYSVSQEQAIFFNHLFLLLEREQTGEFKDREAAIRNYLQLLLIEVGRISDVWQQTHREEAGLRLTKQYLVLVEAHFRKATQMSEYAAKLHVTTNHLIESVKKTLGKSAGEVLQERQLLEAKRLLRYSAAPVDEIANQLGYKDPSYFGRIFKKNVGMSPTIFRKQI